MSEILAAIPVGRFGTLGDAARMVALRVRDDADLFTGATFSLDDGQYRPRTKSAVD